MPKGNRNKKCECCGRRHNADKPCGVKEATSLRFVKVEAPEQTKPEN